MKYLDPQLRSLLAGEYVLGTLQGRARQRFERLYSEDIALQREVAEWEDRLHPLNEDLHPVEPPKRVWRQIKARIAREPGIKRTPWESLWLWRGLSVGALAMSLVLMVTLLMPPSEAPLTADYLAVVRDDTSKPLWLIRADTTQARLELRALKPPSLPRNKSYELWILPGKDQAPISLGLLPRRDRHQFSLGIVERFPLAVGLAVSLEPAGGSPTGQPTGPVLFQADLVHAG